MPEESVPGLRYLETYLSAKEQEALLGVIDLQPWRDDLRRRVQHYGYRYDYKAKQLDRSMFLGPLPDWLAPLATRLSSEGLFEITPQQAIINEYQPKQGISKHIDCIPCFGPTVASLSLGSACVMDLLEGESERVVSLLLQPGSLIVLSGPARDRWQHRIVARKRDNYQGLSFERGRRVSVTFRTVRLGRAIS